MIFVIDLDDTVCDTDSYSEHYIKKFFKEYNLPYKQIAQNVRYAEMKFDWPHDVARSWYKEYGDEMFLHFPVKGNSVNIINQLYGNGHTIIISTARAKDWHVDPEGKTHEWIKKVGLKYHKLYVGRKDKELICAEENADVFIDDDIDIVKRVNDYFTSKNSGKAFLSATGYNQTLDIPNNITVVKNFDEMLKVLQLNATTENEL